jgi:hypothetical protein
MYHTDPNEASWVTLARGRYLRPPASAHDIQIAEDVVGLPLPPLLVRIYLTLANGGFGPGYGLIGAPGAVLADPEHELFEYRQMFSPQPHFGQAIPLCSWGCDIASYVEPRSGVVLRRCLDEEIEAGSLRDWLEAWAASDDALALWEFAPLLP